MSEPVLDDSPEWVGKVKRHLAVAQELVPLTARLLLALLYWVACLTIALFVCITLARALMFVTVWIDNSLEAQISAL